MQRIVYAFAPFYFLRQATRHTTLFFFFFFNDTATTEIYTLSLHDALPISARSRVMGPGPPGRQQRRRQDDRVDGEDLHPSEDETCAQLDAARVERRRDDAERRGVEVQPGQREVRVVGQVERFGAELEFRSFAESEEPRK